MKHVQKIKTLALIAVIGLAAAGCESVTEPKHTLNPNFGNAVRHNMAVQIVNPEASAGITDVPNLDGDRANSVVLEYQKGKTKTVKAIKTSDVGGTQ